MTEEEGQEGVQNPHARWRMESAGDGSSYALLIWTQPGAGQHDEPALRLPMLAGELYRLIGQAERVISWSAPSADGTFTPPAACPPLAPGEVRQQLEICGYIVVSPGVEEHTRLVAATPWASWVEEVPPPRQGAMAWFVNVFAGDAGQLGQAADAYGAECHPAGREEATGGG